jgi:hypothetical protein
MPMKVRNPHRRTGALLLLLLGAAGKPAIATSPGLPSDFDGDGKADVMWRSLATGNDVIWRSASNGSLQAVARVGDLHGTWLASAISMATAGPMSSGATTAPDGTASGDPPMRRLHRLSLAFPIWRGAWPESGTSTATASMMCSGET